MDDFVNVIRFGAKTHLEHIIKSHKHLVYEKGKCAI